MDLTQTVIIVSLILVTGVVVACGVGLFALFRELKVTIQKTNGILDDAKLITTSVAQPVNTFSEFIMGFRNGMKIFNSVMNKKDKTTT